MSWPLTNALNFPEAALRRLAGAADPLHPALLLLLPNHPMIRFLSLLRPLTAAEDFDDGGRVGPVEMQVHVLLDRRPLRLRGGQLVPHRHPDTGHSNKPLL